MREGREEEGGGGRDKKTSEYCDVFLRTCTLCYVVLLFAFTIPLPCQNLRVEIIKGRGNNACGRGNKQRRADKKLSCNVSFLHFQRAAAPFLTKASFTQLHTPIDALRESSTGAPRASFYYYSLHYHRYCQSGCPRIQYLLSRFEIQIASLPGSFPLHKVSP